MRIGRIWIGDRSIYAVRDGDRVVALSEVLAVDDDQIKDSIFPVWNESLDRLHRIDLSSYRTLGNDYRMLVPLDRIPNIRDFYAFEQHVINGRRNRGLEMIKEWYEAPVFYFSNTSSLIASGETVPFPMTSVEKDFEAEFAFIVAREGRDLTRSEAIDSIMGVTCANDWSARDIQRKEVKIGLGPAKAKDFATSLGPWIITMDELIPRIREGVIDLPITASINGKVYSRNNLNSMYWTVGDLVSKASESTRVVPGDVIMSGTVGNGSLLESGGGPMGWLKKGDSVVIEIDGSVRLVNTVG